MMFILDAVLVLLILNVVLIFVLMGMMIGLHNSATVFKWHYVMWPATLFVAAFVVVLVATGGPRPHFEVWSAVSRAATSSMGAAALLWAGKYFAVKAGKATFASRACEVSAWLLTVVSAIVFALNAQRSM